MILASALALAAATPAMDPSLDPLSAPANLYGFKTKDIDGKPVTMSRFKGKALLIVNTASQCGLTPQYKGLQAVWKKYQKQGLVVIGFPANDFGNQEPGTENEIKKFCESSFGVTFPMMSKTTVVGEKKAPLFAWLLQKSGDTKEIEWNFGKFLVGRDGETVTRFSPRQTAESPEVVAAIEKALKAKK